MKTPLTIGLLGLGNIGQGVKTLLDENDALLQRRLGRRIQLKSALVRSLDREVASTVRLTTNPQDILNDPEIDVVVEVMGGEEPARAYITQAIQQGKFVVTANKEVISKHKKALFNLAIQHQVDVFYEAAVGGGIPLIRTLKIGLAANRIESVVGILNGTTNYILTKMTEEKMGYADAVAQAQALGFAEADPSMDVSGLDTAYKLSILASVAFNADVGVSDFSYQGIDQLEQVDIGYAHELGYAIKLVATGRRLADDRLVFGVSPTLIATTHPLASVRNEYNAIYVVGNAVGESMLMGRGAGSSPTASAIVSDIIDIAFNTQRVPSARNLDNGFGSVGLVPDAAKSSQWYMRLVVDDAAGMLAHIGGVFDAHQVSIAQLIQKEKPPHQAELVVVTHEATVAQRDQLHRALASQSGVTGVVACWAVGI